MPLIADMPRGGPRASRFDRMFETDREEYIDRQDTPEKCADALRGLDRLHRLMGAYASFARWTLELARRDGVTGPRILELGAGRGGLSRRILRADPSARLTISDVNPDSVRGVSEGDLGRDPRVTTAVLDATAIDAPDNAFDVAVFAISLHHLPPAAAAAVLREGTRVARRLLVIDGWRNPLYLSSIPLLFLTGGTAHVHDGVISFRKMYSTTALHALADACGAPVELRTRFAFPGYLAATATRRS